MKFDTDILIDNYASIPCIIPLGCIGEYNLPFELENLLECLDEKQMSAIFGDIWEKFQKERPYEYGSPKVDEWDDDNDNEELITRDFVHYLHIYDAQHEDPGLLVRLEIAHRTYRPDIEGFRVHNDIRIEFLFIIHDLDKLQDEVKKRIDEAVLKMKEESES